MYEDLIKNLRISASTARNLHLQSAIPPVIVDQAADAIEELVRQVEYQRRQIDFFMEGKTNVSADG